MQGSPQPRLQDTLDPSLTWTVGNAATLPVMPTTHSITSHYRTQTAINSTDSNRLVAAAGPLFLLMNTLRYTQQSQNIPKLHEQLAHELRAFSAVAQSSQYRSEIIQAARYSLSAFIDDIILHTAWGMPAQWEHYRMVNLFHPEIQDQERFFVILARLLENPQPYLDLLELLYFILSLGYQGHYGATPEDQKQLSQWRDKLYQALRLYRGEFSKLLAAPLSLNNFSKKNNSWRRSVITMACVSVLIFFSMHGLLNIATQPLRLAIASTDQMMTASAS